jgi:hypothetical protein
MIDAGIWGQLPSMINGGIFAETQQCVIQQSHVPTASYGPSGNFVVATQTLDPDHQVTLNAYASLETISIAENVTHTLLIQLDGSTIASAGVPFANNVPVSASYSGVLAAGSHTLEMIYFTQTTGIGVDQLANLNLESQLCG